MLSGNALKIIAAVSMLLDHMGLLLFPGSLWLRIAGRLAFPIFAFMIAEGCRYTRNKKRYFGLIFCLAVIYQVVYYLFDGSLYFSVLVTFSLSILTIFALDGLKARPGLYNGLLFAGAVITLWLLNQVFTIDYGFWGCMVPVFAALPGKTAYDRPVWRLVCLGIGLLLLSMDFGGIQYFSLLALPLLMCYSGKKGKHNMKYFFYIFYPLHLVILQGIAMLTVR